MVVGALAIFEARAAPKAERANEPLGQTEETVTFDPDPVKTGFQKKEDGSLDPKKIKRTVTGTCNPKSFAANAAIVVVDPNGRIEPIAEGDLTRNANAGTIVFNVYGKSMTPVDKADGDTTIQAKNSKGKVVGSVQVIVVIPYTQVHAKVACSPVNLAVNLPNDRFRLLTRGFVFINILVKDQFNNPLDALYNGNQVVIEEFVNRQGDPYQWPAKGPITDPDPDLVNGLKRDVASDACTTESPGTLTPDDILLWSQFRKFFNGKNNCFALNGQKLKASAGQKIWVCGHELRNIVTRTITEEPVNRDGSHEPFDVEDK